MESSLVCRLIQLSLVWLQMTTVVSVCVNLSRNKRARQSTTLFYNNVYWNADHGIDGIIEYQENPLSCSGTKAQTEPWWQLDLGALYTIDRIEVFGRPSSPPYQLLGFQAYVSKENGNRSASSLVYYNNVSRQQYNEVKGHFTVKINSTVARYVSIQIDREKTSQVGAELPKAYSLVLCELMVFKCGNIPGTKKQIYGTAVSGHSPKSWDAILDGNTAQDLDTCKCCAFTDNVMNPWLRVDLSQRIQVSHIIVYGRSDPNNGNLDTLQTLHIYLHDSEWVKGSPLLVEHSATKYTVSNSKQLSPPMLGQFVTFQLEGSRFLILCEVVIKKECPNFSYGEKCLPCGHCRDKEPCDKDTGQCTQCETGYQAPFCKKQCQPGHYGDCKHTCGACNSSDLCDFKTGICPNGCEKGYKATPFCDQACPDFTYGQHCLNACGNCKNKETCNSENGHCVQCEAGYQSPLCKKECQLGHYGDCTHTCGSCKSSDICDVKTGICPHGCDKGYKPTPRCNLECEDHYFGYNCSDACGHCFRNTPCNKPDGHCAQCDLGFEGDLCKTKCKPGFYGDCRQKCGSCISSDTCDAKTGICPNGCDKGYKATPKCDQACDDHYYESNCSQSCGSCSNNAPCDKYDGHCSHCEPGSSGRLCKDKCVPGYYGDTCTQTCGGCKSGDVCHFKTGDCPNGCDKGYNVTLKCDQVCGRNTYGQNCVKNCTNCRNDICYPGNGTCTYGCIKNFHGERCDMYSEDTDESKSDGLSTTITASVSTVAAVVSVIVVVAVVILLRRRLQMNKNQSAAEDNGNVYENADLATDQTAGYMQLSQLRGETIYSQLGESQQTKGHDYYNFAHPINGVKIARLWSYIQHMKRDNCRLFNEDFKRLQMDLAENQSKQRRLNEYQERRVVLDIDEEGAIDYINAFYINGNERVDKFIASQDPNNDTESDFWRMVWQQNSSMIVMFTKLHENGLHTRTTYWPGPGETEKVFGKINVKFVSGEDYGDFVIRKLNVSKGIKGSSTVTQYHFKAYQDSAFPNNTWCLVKFWRQVMSDDTEDIRKSPPIVVHCSPDTGWTGTFIALDKLYHQAKTDGSLKPYNMLETLRRQLKNMIHSKEQYVFLHEAVAEALLCGTSPIRLDQYKDVYSFLTGNDPDTGKSRMQLQYELMTESLKDHQDSNVANDYSNVYSQVSDNTREESRQNGSSSMNFIRCPHQEGPIVVTTGTLDELWSFVVENKIKTFVIASELDDLDDSTSVWRSSEPNGNLICVKLIYTRKENGFIEGNFSLSSQSKDNDCQVTVRQFELTTWLEGTVPNDPASIIRLYDAIKRWQPHLNEAEPILIHCRDDPEKSGLLYTVLTILFQLESDTDDKQLNILETVMNVRKRNRSLVPNYEQYKFIHDVIVEFLSLNQAAGHNVYENYRE